MEIKSTGSQLVEHYKIITLTDFGREKVLLQRGSIETSCSMMAGTVKTFQRVIDYLGQWLI